MMRGTYANLRLRNELVPDREGWWTRAFPEDEVVDIFEATRRYRERGTPMIVLAGRDFGSGSSRDWAAKGPALLGVKAVLAQSFERIHRSNMIGVGILPLLFPGGESRESLELTGEEIFDFRGMAAAVSGKGSIDVTARAGNGRIVRFQARPDIRTEAEADLLRKGGIFQAALQRQMLA
jgi:aconitate hydratase